LATQAAQKELARAAQGARVAIEAERDQMLARMRLSLRHQGLEEEAIEAQAARERSHYAALLKALEGLKVSLDSVAGFVINR
jgi:ATP-dependent helicase HepA